MSNTSKEALRAEIVKLCADAGKPAPEGLDAMKQVDLFDVLEALTGQKDPRRPGAPAGAIRATPSAPPAPPAPSEATSTVPDVESPPAPPAPAPAPEEPTAVAEKPTRFRVANGKLLHCLCGPLGAFQEVRAIDLSGGEEELEELLAAGTVEPARR